MTLWSIKLHGQLGACRIRIGSSPETGTRKGGTDGIEHGPVRVDGRFLYPFLCLEGGKVARDGEVDGAGHEWYEDREDHVLFISCSLVFPANSVAASITHYRDEVAQEAQSPIFHPTDNLQLLVFQLFRIETPIPPNDQMLHTLRQPPRYAMRDRN